jgi:hypothetical protein
MVAPVPRSKGSLLREPENVCCLGDGRILALLTTTLNPTEALDPTNWLVPAKVAVNVCIPAWFGVIWQVAIPLASVVAEQPVLPSAKLTVCPARGTGGLTDTSDRAAITPTACPSLPLVGLELRVRKVKCFPVSHVT